MNETSFVLGQDLLTLLDPGTTTNTSVYHLEVQETFPANGTLTGNFFNSEDFYVFVPAAGASSAPAATTPVPGSPSGGRGGLVLTEDQKIALGVGIGVGVPGTLAALYMCFFGPCRR